MPSSFHNSNTRSVGSSANAKANKKDQMPDLRPSHENQRLLSWPPTQVRLRPTMGPDDDSDVPILEREQDFGLYINEDPLTYFLTPAPALDTDGDMAMMDFDAGIDPEVDEVRSVSPSSLDGGSSSSGHRSFLSSGPFRPPTPPRSPMAHPLVADSTTDEDEDEDEDDNEDYVRLGPNHGLPPPPFTLRDFASLDKARRARSSAASGGGPPASSRPEMLSPSASFPSPSSSPRGRTVGRFGPGRGAAPAGVVPAPPRRRLSPRSWRQPSPDVWSIEEEPEDNTEATAEKGGNKTGAVAGALSGKQADVSLKAKKRVRFVLPDNQE